MIVTPSGAVRTIASPPALIEKFGWMFVPLRRHWYWKGPLPEATTLKAAVAPLATVWLAGWVAMPGGARAASAAQ